MVANAAPDALAISADGGADGGGAGASVLPTVQGRVTLAGAPIAGVVVRLGTQGRTRAARTDERGRFELASVPPGAYALRAELPARGLGAFVPVDVALGEDGAAAVRVDVALVPTVRIVGTVKDEAGKPLPGAFVRVEEEDRPLPIVVESGADGRFVVEDRLRGRGYRVSVQRAGFLADGPRLVKAGAQPIDVRLRKGATLDGVVVDEHGAPVVGADVAVVSEEAGSAVPSEGATTAPVGDGWAHLEPSGELGVMRGPVPYPPLVPTVAPAAVVESRLPRTDGKGAFRIAELPAGRLVVTARHPDFAGAASAPALLVAGAARSVRLELVRGATLRGRVLDERRTGVPDAEVTTDDGRTVLSDGGGAFSIPHVARDVRLTARRRGFLRGELTVEVGAARAEVTCEITLRRALGQLGGEVVDARGGGIEGARLSITPSGGETTRVTTERGGRFLVEGLADGPYRVVVEHAAWARLGLPAVEATREARLVLEPGGGIEGEVLDPRLGVPPPDTRLELVTSGETRRIALDGRRFRALALPSGPARLVASARGYPRVERAIDILAADRPAEVTVRDLRIELELGGQIRGRVRDDRGAPIAGASVSVDAHGVDAVRTDADGVYVLVGVPSGRVEVTARPAADPSRSAREEVEVRANEESRMDLVVGAR